MEFSLAQIAKQCSSIKSIRPKWSTVFQIGKDLSKVVKHK